MDKKQVGLEFEQFAANFVGDPLKYNLKPDSFLKLPLTAFKDCANNIADLIGRKLSIKTIGDLAQWSNQKEFSLLSNVVSELSISEFLFEKWILIARMAYNIKESKRSEMVNTKILFMGLGAAGKSSLIEYYFYRAPPSEALNTTPTLGVNSKNVKFPDGTLSLWELGGQSKFHSLYFTNPEKYFLALDTLVYIVDLQDAVRFKESCMYFIQILEILKRLEQSCQIILLFHKADPQFMASPLFLENFQQTWNLFIPEIKKRNFPYIPRLTSIYNPISKLEEEIGAVLNLNFISHTLLQDGNHPKRHLKDQIKSFFKRDQDKHQVAEMSFKVGPDIRSELELETEFQVLQSESIKNHLDTKEYEKIIPFMDSLFEVWQRYKENRKLS
jgi:GTPase SAR1 family protein